jgi:hypothetical protein
MTRSDDAEAEWLTRRLEVIEDGLREGIRREVARLRRLGLPVYVYEDGCVVERPKPRAS